MVGRKGQGGSLVGVVVGGVLALVIGAIIIYQVGIPIMNQVNATYNLTGGIPQNQSTNINTVYTLLGFCSIIVALVVFVSLAKMAG